MQRHIHMVLKDVQWSYLDYFHLFYFFLAWQPNSLTMCGVPQQKKSHTGSERHELLRHEFSVGKNLCVTHNEKHEGQIRDLRVSPKPTNYSQHTQSKHGLSQHAGDIKDIPARENYKRLNDRDKSLRWMYEKSEAFITSSIKRSVIVLLINCVW